MSPRMKGMLIAVAVLVLVNLWRWWPEHEPVQTAQNGVQERQSRSLELRLVGYDPRTAGEVIIRRDLFFPLVDKSADKSADEKQAVKETIQKPVNSQRQRVLQELEQYKLVGVLSRNGIRRGFLVRDENNFSVKRGDRVQNRYSVDEITLTSVTLSDPDSRVSRKIELE